MTLPLADCGHAYHPPGPAGGPAGYATDPETNRTMCYPCADGRQRAEIAALPVCGRHGAYFDDRKAELTTWPGGRLATVTAAHYGPVRYTPTGGRYRRLNGRAVSPDGHVWAFRGTDTMDCVTMRRIK